jgi:hypothetical protein
MHRFITIPAFFMLTCCAALIPVAEEIGEEIVAEALTEKVNEVPREIKTTMPAFVLVPIAAEHAK